ncbi:MAG: DUF1998 domain-containing protein, partial [Dactylosporangium sp.]|nr:DUF1998 domain-containing protein [Dactylosporangium sp.]
PCDRCHEPRIADAGNVYKVLVPTRVIARDRRDDARIDDDSDDRESRTYSIVTAIDIDPSRIESSWKHGNATFGADFTRHAVVRTFNLGAARYDRAPDHAFAGDDVRLNPFHVCGSCGGASADPLPTSPADLLGPAPVPSATAREDHHLPWCLARRGGAVQHHEIVLAHELHTEALRILVPAVTALVKERRVSFAAALRLGLAARYGGEPDHLRIEYASMPARDNDATDASTKDAKRTFVIVYDTQPSGTGYLQRLADPEEMRGVLAAARAVILDCPCRGEDPRGCHRCLLRYARDSEFALISRHEALSMLDDLLREWSLAPSDKRMDEISLISQIESELEARFLRALEERGRTPGSGFTFTRESVGGPARVGELRFAPVRPGEPGTRWRMRLQNTIHGTRPDVHFIRLDGERIEVAVYLDGYQYHAASDILGRDGNRIADDADKRNVLRGHGFRVFQVTWDDVERWRGATVSRPEVWPPYGGLVQEKVRDIYRQLSGRDASELATTLWAQPLDQLFAFLADPDARVWRWRAEAALGGLLAVQGRTMARYDSAALPKAVAAALRGDPLPPETGGGITLVRAVARGGGPRGGRGDPPR